MALFTAGDLTSWLQYDVSDDQAEVADQVVSGWLLDAMEVDVLPVADPGGRLFAWALELGGIAVENPTSLTQEQSQEVSTAWSVARRREILASVRSWAARQSGRSGGAPRPRGSFPAVQGWPDRVGGPWR